MAPTEQVGTHRAGVLTLSGSGRGGVKTLHWGRRAVVFRVCIHSPPPPFSSGSGWPAVALAHKSEEVIHQRANGKNVVFIHSGSDNFQSNFIILLDDDVLIAGLVAGRV